ncbi:tail protein X [Sphingomonas sp.]|uniref:tail protein X n=1 Tax=Sphingomonas sp. TaxID=28214 RepID=UPI00307E7B37
MIVTARQGDTIDLLCWRAFGRTDGVTEQALALNPGIAASGPTLAPGLRVTLPDLDQAAPLVRETVSLWD